MQEGDLDCGVDSKDFFLLSPYELEWLALNDYLIRESLNSIHISCNIYFNGDAIDKNILLLPVDQCSSSSFFHGCVVFSGGNIIQ